MGPLSVRHILYVSSGVWNYVEGSAVGNCGMQVGSMDKEPQVRGCYNITFICTPTNQETVSVLEKTPANKHLEHESKCKI